MNPMLNGMRFLKLINRLSSGTELGLQGMLRLHRRTVKYKFKEEECQKNVLSKIIKNI